MLRAGAKKLLDKQQRRKRRDTYDETLDSLEEARRAARPPRARRGEGMNPQQKLKAAETAYFETGILDGLMEYDNAGRDMRGKVREAPYQRRERQPDGTTKLVPFCTIRGDVEHAAAVFTNYDWHVSACR